MVVLKSLLFVVLAIVSVFLIILVLIQRGRGGGLVGMLGGSGSSSAFGARTGDVFTKITIYTACVWGALCMILVRSNNQATGGFAGMGGGTPPPTSSSTTTPGKSDAKSDGKAAATPKTGTGEKDELPKALDDEKL